MGNINQAIRLYELDWRAACRVNFLSRLLYRFAELSKRNLAWDSARILWAKAVDYGEVDAAVELAKYYEHQARDYDSASIGLRPLKPIWINCCCLHICSGKNRTS
jgi:3-deoxy-D-manno-octulosonic-acid transferase